jgi:hypothetical protein
MYDANPKHASVFIGEANEEMGLQPPLSRDWSNYWPHLLQNLCSQWLIYILK